MPNRYMKRCSAPLVIRDRQIKTTTKYHFTPVGMNSIEKATNNECRWERGEKGPTACALLAECILVRPLWKIALKFLKKKIKVELSDDPAMPLLIISLEEMKTLTLNNICTSTLIATSFTTAKMWKQLQCPSTDGRIKVKYIWGDIYGPPKVQRYTTFSCLGDLYLSLNVMLPATWRHWQRMCRPSPLPGPRSLDSRCARALLCVLASFRHPWKEACAPAGSGKFIFPSQRLIVPPAVGGWLSGGTSLWAGSPAVPGSETAKGLAPAELPAQPAVVLPTQAHPGQQAWAAGLGQQASDPGPTQGSWAPLQTERVCKIWVSLLRGDLIATPAKEQQQPVSACMNLVLTDLFTMSPGYLYRNTCFERKRGFPYFSCRRQLCSNWFLKVACVGRWCNLWLPLEVIEGITKVFEQ